MSRGEPLDAAIFGLYLSNRSITVAQLGSIHIPPRRPQKVSRSYCITHDSRQRILPAELRAAVMAWAVAAVPFRLLPRRD